MMVTCPACGRKAAVAEKARDVVCDCGRRFDPAARPTVADPFLGHTFGGYRIEEVIGTGGMGTVYKATQLSLDRPVAFKVLPPNVADDPQFVQRFHREAEALASLSHPHIVQIIDRGEAQGRYFIVMEYVDGRSLRDLVKGGNVPPKEACRIISALLGALDFAHERSIVHRDIKPENVLVSRGGVVKVADFGLSRFLGTGDLDARLTRTHLVLGTYEYMAPEQREATRQADARADIYATAVVLYEMLTGELPIGRFDMPSRKVPGLDRRLDRILERGLAKDPDDRYERASVMGAELESLLSAPGAPVDLNALKQAAGRVADKIHAGAAEIKRMAGGLRKKAPRPAAPSPAEAGAPRRPVGFEMRLDLVLTILAVSGLLLLVAGVVLLFEEADIEIGLAAIDRDVAGIVCIAYGLMLWNAAERARKYWPGARTMLLTLTAIAIPTLVAIPLTIWTWVVLLAPTMRIYMDARHRGLDETQAAALAQGLPVAERVHAAAYERRLDAAKANNRVAYVLACIAGAVMIGWVAFAIEQDGFKDEGAALLSAVGFLSFFTLLFGLLAQRVRDGKWLRMNAFVWTLLGPVAKKSARRARELVRDRRHGLA